LQLNFLPPFRWRQTETLAFFWTIRKSDYFAAFWKGFRIVGKIEREDDGKGDLAFGQFNGLIVQSNLFGEVVGQGQEAEGSVGLLDVAKHLQERFLQRSIVLKKVGLKEGHFLGQCRTNHQIKITYSQHLTACWILNVRSR
jgi:hypothetical protein